MTDESRPELAVFVSYRRNDVPDATDRLAASLIERLGRDQVFLDVDSIEIGAPFAKVIGSWISRCDVVLVVIGHGWLTATDDEGALRLGNPRDYVRLELEAALSRDMRVVPLLVHGARMPRATELPESLVPLLERNALELTRTYWELDVARLIGALERSVVDDKRKRAERETAAAREAQARRAEQEATAARQDQADREAAAAHEIHVRQADQDAATARDAQGRQAGPETPAAREAQARRAEEEATAAPESEARSRRMGGRRGEVKRTTPDQADREAAAGRIPPTGPLEPADRRGAPSSRFRWPGRVVAGVGGAAILVIVIVAIVLSSGSPQHASYSWHNVNATYGLSQCHSGVNPWLLLPARTNATEDCGDLADVPAQPPGGQAPGHLDTTLGAYSTTSAAEAKAVSSDGNAVTACPWPNTSGRWQYGQFSCYLMQDVANQIHLVWTDSRFHIAGDIVSYPASGFSNPNEQAWRDALRGWKQLDGSKASTIAFAR